jgi:hypothetical protein
MIAFTVDPDWYREHWYGEGVVPGDEGHCATLLRSAKFAAARAMRAAATTLGVVRGAVARKPIGECS